MNAASVGAEHGGKRRRLPSPGGSRCICLDEAGVSALRVGKSIWEQRAGPKSPMLEQPLVYEIFLKYTAELGSALSA